MTITVAEKLLYLDSLPSGGEPNVRYAPVSGDWLFDNHELHTGIEAVLRPKDTILIIRKDGKAEYQQRDNFLPEQGYLMHFNIATAVNRPHIEPLPDAHNTISTEAIRMIEGQKQYVLEMEAGVIGVIENGVMRPMYIGTIVDVGDRTPRVDQTGRTHKTWTRDIKDGGSTGASTTWVEVKDWDEVEGVELQYWVYDDKGEIALHTPNASANSLKLWGKRLGDWVGNYPPEKLAKLGIVEGKPFLLSTGQILFEDDGARSIDPRVMPKFTARGVMTFGEGKTVETIIEGKTVVRSDETFTPNDPPLSWYE